MHSSVISAGDFVSPPTTLIADAQQPSEVRRRRWQNALLGWLASLVFHACLVIALGLVPGRHFLGIRHGPFDNVIGSPGGTFVSTFGDAAGAGDPFFDDERPGEESGTESPGDSREAASGGPASAVAGSLADIAGGPPPVDVTAALPGAMLASANPGGPNLGGASGGVSGGGGLLNAPHKPGGSHGKYARTHIYGTTGEGSTFVYVFDRSSSMQGGGYDLLASAKRELLASLDDLGEDHRFQIIFYNERPTKMDLGRGFAGLVFAQQRSKELARKFVESIDAAGGTRHFEALKEALRLKPDVIFFLTDADEPGMSDGQLSLIRHLNGGHTKINTIEFGERPQPRRNNFLARIAQENGGEYVYMDVTRK
jgi:hypothetical protein